MWTLLWGEPTLANLLAGFALAFLVLWLLPMPRVGFEGRVWIPGMVTLLAAFVRDVLVAAAHLAWYAISPKRTPHGAIIRVQLRSHSDVLLTITAQFTSLVPGSVVVEAHRLTGLVYVHVFDAEISGGIEEARATVLEQERRIMYALASDSELAAAGYPPRGLLRIRKELGPQHITEEERRVEEMGRGGTVSPIVMVICGAPHRRGPHHARSLNGDHPPLDRIVPSTGSSPSSSRC